MLHEVILALLGHPGAIIQEEPRYASKEGGASTAAAGSFRVPDSITFLTKTEREAINRVVGMGSTYRELRRFIRPVYDAQDEGGLYLRALKQGVCEVLDEYAENVAKVESDVMTDPTLTLARVYAGVREYQAVLPAIAEACDAVTCNDGSGGASKGPQLLEVLHERSHFGAPDVRRRLRRLVWHCSQVLINQCASWLLHGLLVDPCREFFVQKNIDPITLASVSATRSGNAVDLGDSELPSIGNDRWSALNVIVEGGWEGTVDWRAEEEWNSTYTLRLPLIPTAFVPHGLAQKMLFVGKVVRVLRQANPSPLSTAPAPPAAWRRESRLGAESTGNDDHDDNGDDDAGEIEADVLELTKHWSELRDRDAFHLLALERAVHEAHALVDRRLYRLLVNVSGLERHLANFKGLFLMGHGALFHAFFDKARDAMRVKAGDRAVLDLNTWLAAAADDCDGGGDGNGDGDADEHDASAARSASPSLATALRRVRFDLDPPGFSCKAFQDLARQGFCVTGAATSSSKKSSVCLCPGGPGPQAPSSRKSAASPSSASTSTPMAASTSSSSYNRPRRRAGSLWYASDREVARGFQSSIAFRCDRPKHDLGADSRHGRKMCDGQAEATGSLSFVVHQHRAALSGEDGGDDSRGGGRGGESAMVPNSLYVRLEPDGEGGGQLSIRWNPHRLPSPSRLRPEIERGRGFSPVDTTTALPGASTSAPEDHVGAAVPETRQSRDQFVRSLGQTRLPHTCRLSLDQINYLLVDYCVGQPRSGRFRGREDAGARGGSRVGAGGELMVYVNDPGRSGSPALSVKLDMWKLIELAGGRAFVGVSAQGPWRTTLRQWDFQLGGSSAAGKLGPLGGVGSGPAVEEMLEAMYSWSGLCLDYRLEWPLHLVLTRETIQTYNRLFRRLASVKRANLELERVWPTLMQSRYRGLGDRDKAWLGPLWILRARMAFFVSNLAFYLQVDVVEASYALLRTKLEAVRNFVSLQRAHQEFLATLRAKFYIDNLDISQGLGRALRHVLRFCCLFALHGDAKDIPQGEVVALHDAFQDEMQLLVPVLENLAKELMMRLDFNGHFSAEAFH